MKLTHGFHLSYSTNIHRGEDWAQTFDSLKRYTLAVKQQICPGGPYAIGLRLSHQASCELSAPATLREFQHWLEDNHCYVFTINGFPYGKFHGSRVKEQVYAPDWTTGERVEYTNRLFDILSQLVPHGIEGSVSTVPCSFKRFIRSEEQKDAMRANLWRCVEQMARLSDRSGKLLHLGLEPEPLCYLETSAETIEFFEQLRDDHPDDELLNRHLGVNYDTCHLAVEFEDADALDRLQQHGIKISKIHFSSALRVEPNAEAMRALRAFADDVYLHQVVARGLDGVLSRFEDLDMALKEAAERVPAAGTEWRIHFHIPLHYQPRGWFGTTTDHILGVMNRLKENPALCSHLEMETYTWEVLPSEMKNRSVVDQLVSEYRWTLDQLSQRGID